MLPAGVFISRPLNPVVASPGNRRQRTLNRPPLLEHALALDGADIVEVEIDRQAPRLSETKIERGAALEGEDSR